MAVSPRTVAIQPLPNSMITDPQRMTVTQPWRLYFQAITDSINTLAFITSGTSSLAPSGGGDVTGPASATPDAIVLFSGATGKIIKNSGILLSQLATSSHAITHENGGSDPLPLDTLAPPTDILTLNSTTGAHGLLPKLSGVSTQFLNGVGAWVAPAAGVPAHHTTHEFGGSDAVTLAESQITNLVTDLAAKVAGPASSLNNSIAIYSGTTGKIIKDSAIQFGNVAIKNVANVFTAANDFTASTLTAATVAPGTNSTAVATTAFVTAAIAASPSGDVVGPASATDNAVAIFSGTTGKLLKNSQLLWNDSVLLLAFGGISTTLPALRRGSGANLEVVTSDQVGFANVVCLNAVVQPGGSLFFSTRGQIVAVADGVVRLADSASSGFGRLQFGGGSALFPALQRTGTALNLVLADLSGDAALTAATATAGTSTTQVATTAFVTASFAPLASPALTGVPIAPTATAGTSTTQIATTAFVQSAVAIPALHHTTHETGGTDAITSLSASVLTSGTIATARLPAYYDFPEGTPANPAADIDRLYSVDVQGFTFLEVRDSGGQIIRLARDTVAVAKVSQAGGVTVGQAVYVSGASGANRLVSLARADTETTLPAIGLVLDAGANNAFIRILTSGLLSGVDTSGLTVGAELFVSPTTAGALTTTQPLAPQLIQRVGYVLRQLLSGDIGVSVASPMSQSAWDPVHASMHQAGGSDPLTALSTSILTGTLQAAQEPAHTGDVTNTAGSLVLAIGASKVTNAMLAGSITASNLVGTDIVIAESQVTNLFTDLAAKADKISPTFTGIPAAPTATVGTSTTQIATTAFVQAALGSSGLGDVVGPGSATNNALAVFNGTTGKVIRNSSVTESSGTLTASVSVFAGNGSNAMPFLNGSSGVIGWVNKTLIDGTIDGNLLLRNNGGTGFGLLQLGGTSTSFPALKPNSAGLEVRLANDSGLTTLAALNVLLGVTPATTGALRLSNNTGIYTKNGSTVDVRAFICDGGDEMHFGSLTNSGAFTYLDATGAINLRTSGGASSATYSFDAVAFFPLVTNVLSIGKSTLKFTDAFFSGALNAGSVSVSGTVFATGGLGATVLNATNLTSGTVPDARLATNIPRFTEGTWTPTDASGGSFTLTVNWAKWKQVGNIVTGLLGVVYPSTTGSGLAAKIGGFPPIGPTTEQFAFIVYTDSGLPILGLGSSGLASINLINSSTGAAITNAQLSGKIIRGSFFYFTT